MEASRLELEAQRLAEEVETADGERDDARAQAARLASQAVAREAEHRETRRRLAAEAESARIRINSLTKDLELASASGGAEGSGFELAVTAPCAGTVLRLRVNAPGALVREGEVLSEMACAGERLQAELLVPQAGVPMVAAGQGVKLRYDAFPYQRFGVRFGTVRWVGQAGGDSAGALFRAIVDVPDAAIRVRGAPRPLLPGMGGRADIVVGRRSLASFAFEPIRQLRETFAEVPDSATRRP
jgi:multidrug efflux pump subunit AcrA (membrane-fusion protein)